MCKISANGQKSFKNFYVRRSSMELANAIGKAQNAVATDASQEEIRHLFEQNLYTRVGLFWPHKTHYTDCPARSKQECASDRIHENPNLSRYRFAPEWLAFCSNADCHLISHKYFEVQIVHTCIPSAWGYKGSHGQLTAIFNTVAPATQHHRSGTCPNQVLLSM